MSSVKSVLVLVFVSSAFDSSLSQNTSARNFNSECGQVFSAKQFVIESPNYPTNYPLNYECSYLIKGPPCPVYFEFQFLDFNLEDSLGCSKDRLEVDNQDALCGNQKEIKRYFSHKGTLALKFLSDNDSTGRGYRISVTRSPCASENAETTTIYNVQKWHTTNKDVEYTTTARPKPSDRKLPKCCPRAFGSKTFILTSPNFPYSMSTNTECIYEIYRSSQNICRLRIHAEFFWLGQYSTSCPEGFLEIDGRYICGCKSNLKIISSFEETPTKVLRFVSYGQERNSYSGFLLEIIQDECPKKYIPEKLDTNRSFEGNIRFYNDEINRVAWPSSSHGAITDKLHLINEDTEVLVDQENVPNVEKTPKVIRHVYYFAESNSDQVPKDREETDYIDISNVRTSLLQSSYGYEYCLNWNRQQFDLVNSKSLPVCKVNEGSALEKKCIDLHQQKGYFKSPGYPFYYRSNMNICYRFKKLPGMCKFLIHLKDFAIENSPGCVKDYLLFTNQLRYCGSQLSNTISSLDVRNKPYEEINFVTDAFYCGRVFYGVYEQIACEENPINPPTTSSPSMVPCSRTIQEKMFTMEVYGYNGPICSFILKKTSPYVCAVSLYFEKFDLLCAFESLVIGGTMYCGHMSGQTVRLEVTNQDPVLVYRKSSYAGVNSGLRFKIQGLEISDDCSVPEVPPERLTSAKALNVTNAENTTFVVKFNKQFKGICGIITNTTEVNLPATFCDFVMRNHDIIQCLPLRENLLNAPAESPKFGLILENAETTEEIEFKEIDCDMISDLK